MTLGAPAGPPVAAETQLFVYWRVAANELDEALQRLSQAHAALEKDEPGLVAGLYVRPGSATEAGEQRRGAAGPATPATVMETYRRPGGIDAPAEVRIHARATQALAGLAVGPRHTERFRPVRG